MSTLHGKAVTNKGMALFPRKIGGRYAMLSRQDGENNYIMFSDNIYFWQKSKMIQKPELPWEFIQIGNCGSPWKLIGLDRTHTWCRADAPILPRGGTP